MTDTHNEKTFISYRKKPSTWQALSVYYALSVVHKRKIWLDWLLRPGKDWREAIFSTIKSCKYFVLILAPETLDNCRKIKDILREEILYALSIGRTPIPLFFDFDWKEERERLIEKKFWYKIPAKIRNLSDIEGKSISFKGFEQEIKDLHDTSFSNEDDITIDEIPPTNQNTLLQGVALSALDSQKPIPGTILEFKYSVSDKILSTGYVGETINFLDFPKEEMNIWFEEFMKSITQPISITSDTTTGDLKIEFVFFPKTGLGTAFDISLVNSSEKPITISNVYILFEPDIKVSYHKLKSKYIQLVTPLPVKLLFSETIDFIFPLFHMRQATSLNLNPENIHSVEITDSLGNSFIYVLTEEERKKIQEYWKASSWNINDKNLEDL